ncbi:transient receptor potential channel-like [Liolophura sinensis]|uniref:transient receptor potential channel-like n=1 Tax=Liolophura sinensis TaxID=3198878 RepID=UPI00315944BE
MIFFRPFWHIFGAMQLEDMHYEMKTAARNACLEEDFNMWDPGKWTSCYTGWMAPIFTALFVFLANLVLFTYIIGVVSHYYGKTKEQTERIWATEIFKLISWSAQLPLPPPPLNIVWFIIRFLLTLILLVYIGVLWIVRRRKRYDEPEELMVNYPGCFSTYLHILWMLTWFYQTPYTNYAKPAAQKRLLLEKVMADMDFKEVLSSPTAVRC